VALPTSGAADAATILVLRREAESPGVASPVADPVNEIVVHGRVCFADQTPAARAAIQLVAQRVLAYVRELAHKAPFLHTLLPLGTPGYIIAQLSVSAEVGEDLAHALEDTERIDPDGWR
jgi:hypothetical protein